jgi:phosphoribosylformylglycinamidine synthase
LILSAHDVSEGGLFITLMESAFNKCLGFDVTKTAAVRDDAYWFGEGQSRVVVSVAASSIDKLEVKLKGSNIPFEKLGSVIVANVAINGEDWGTINSWKDKYDNAIANLLAGHESEGALSPL